MQTLSADDFPDLAVGEIGHEFTMEAGDLKRLIDKTKFAISTEETRYYLNGIYLHPAGDDGTKTLVLSRPTVIAWRRWNCRCRRACGGYAGGYYSAQTVHERRGCSKIWARR
ncbi:hypothetical protein [Bradyrhizobium sp. RDI18]|uniref:DNA polymerase III subunit beta family protein n=1 Tax=Bradyrhizobium sp. RDI18 TaxID=3367400 RepID=UPI0037131AF5